MMWDTKTVNWTETYRGRVYCQPVSVGWEQWQYQRSEGIYRSQKTTGIRMLGEAKGCGSEGNRLG